MGILDIIYKVTKVIVIMKGIEWIVKEAIESTVNVAEVVEKEVVAPVKNVRYEHYVEKYGAEEAAKKIKEKEYAGNCIILGGLGLAVVGGGIGTVIKFL